MTPLRIALLGAGTFVRDAHLPALQQLQDQFEIVAVFSRTRASAEALAAKIHPTPDIYTNIAEILQRDDVDAVDIVLPIEQLTAAVDMALASGKHVISEKPITPTVADGKKLLSVYSHHPSQVWMVAENWRYEAAFMRAPDALERIGTPYLCHWALHLGVMPGAKYYVTDWRRSGTFPGGFLMDGGVHHIAALRLVLGEIARVTAFAAQMRPDLPPVDTLTAALRFESGLIGSYSVTYASTAPFASHLTVIGEKGTLRVNRDFLELTLDGQTEALPLAPSQGVTDELAAFARTVRLGEPHHNSPQQALQDVAVVEAMLRSAETGASVEVEQFV